MNDLGDIIERPIPNSDGNHIVELIRKFDWLRNPVDPLMKGWVAGGAAMKLALGYSHLGDSDIDVFVSHYLRRDETKFAIGNADADIELQGSNDAFVNFRYLKRLGNGGLEYEMPIQLITRRTYEYLDDLYEDFDFTCCMFSTDGYTLKAPEQAWKDLENRVLRLHKTDEGRRRKTIKRIAKYAAHGFNPEPGMLTALFDEIPDGYTFDPENACLHADTDNY